MKFLVVNHCHLYERLLAYQLSSLVLHTPEHHQVEYVLYHADGDDSVMDVYHYFLPKMPSHVHLRNRPMDLGLIKNRAVGRNEASLSNEADWVWFADTDYLMIDNAWDDLAEAVKHSDAEMVWPRFIYETDWDAGDDYIGQMSEIGVRDVNVEKFASKRMRRAIGGMQFAYGPTVRKIGYCSHYQGPSDDWNFRSDVSFRRSIKKHQEINMSSLLRIRHSRKGYGDKPQYRSIN